MREEISEPQHWRTRPSNSASATNSWAARRRQAELPVEVVDAAFGEETTSVTPVRASRRDSATRPEQEGVSAQNDILQSLSNQMALLEAQREQLQKLLDEAQG